MALDKQEFFGPVVKSSDKGYTLDFVYVDKDGSNGFPGDLEVQVSYAISGKDKAAEIEVQYQAKLLTGSETPINLTNHSYWNISGQKTIDGTKVKLGSHNALKVDSDLIPTNEIEVKKVDELEVLDNCFVLTEKLPLDTRNLPLIQACEACHENSSVTMKVLTTEPSFQVYTGDYMGYEGKYGLILSVNFIGPGILDYISLVRILGFSVQ